MSGLAVAGRVALPGQPVAVAVGEGAVWVLLQGALLRVDADRHRVTGSVELGPPAGDMTVIRWPWGRARSGSALETAPG